MNPIAPPPLPLPGVAPPDRRRKLLVGLAVLPAACVGVLVVLRLCGLIRPVQLPTGTMAPAIPPGNHIITEGLTFLTREPRRGEIVVFKTDGLPALPQGQFYIARIAGEPGEHLRITESGLYIDERPVALSNAAGVIRYHQPASRGIEATFTDVEIPTKCYFLLGDNSANSYDSRFWGNVPRKNIQGRAWFCYWPPQRVGIIR